jgi:hypothetical protein
MRSRPPAPAQRRCAVASGLTQSAVQAGDTQASAAQLKVWKSKHSRWKKRPGAAASQAWASAAPGPPPGSADASLTSALPTIVSPMS